MPKLTTIYTCSNCGAQSPKWSGRCLDCGAWGTFEQETIDVEEQKSRGDERITPAKVIDFAAIPSGELQRIKTNIDEFDRVLGGGIVPGSVILVGGEPGIGKSTLMLQISGCSAPSLGAEHPSTVYGQANTLYISGEESAQQIKSRIERLHIENSPRFISETNVEKIISTIIDLKPQLVIVDSIQTIYSSDVPSEPGSINQVRACAVKLLQTAKDPGIRGAPNRDSLVRGGAGSDVAIIITGHITKDGFLAGPKSLEHLVDTVIYLEQQKNKDFRILRTVKNRFGSTDEIGLFEMTDSGFKEIKDPSGIFLEKTPSNSGTVVSCIMEGTRPFLVEVQALATKTVFGYPQRKASGIDLNRLQILIAVLTKRAGMNLMNQDVHINVVGGLRITETALDLGICAAIISSLLNQVMDKDTVVLGEVGLGGEIRNIYKLEQRLQEAGKLGFRKAIIPKMNIASKLELVKMENVGELVKYITDGY